jgi:hypothetical protein
LTPCGLFGFGQLRIGTVFASAPSESSGSSFRGDAMEPTFSQGCLQLGVTGLQLLALMSNAQFPVATKTDGIYSWSSGPINSFDSLWAQALANGWKISTALMPTANIALMASTVPSPYHRPRPVDPLFDDFA